MNGLFSAAATVTRFCEERSWRHCLIGGLAVLRWGEPRVTRDVDVTVLSGFGGEAPYVDALLERFSGRLSAARDFALQHRVVLVQTSSGVGVDVTLAALPFEERAVARSSWWQVAPEVSLRTCSAEDLVVFKAFAGRPRDWSDIESVIARQGPRLDRGLILEEVAPLLAAKEVGDGLDRLTELLSTS